jgi:uroporphyrin-III C-methyltransferase
VTKLDAIKELRGTYPILEPGHVWLAGAGPGDPGLLTLDAVAGMLQADVILHDALIDARVLAFAGPQSVLEHVGKRAGRPSMRQIDISIRIIELARARKRVVRLKGGDPMIFGRGGDEAMALAAAGIPYRIVSGVTAGLAALAAALIPATLRGVNQTIVFTAGYSGTEHVPDWAALAQIRQPIVVYMAMRSIPGIVDALMRGGLAPDTAAAVIMSATTANERIVISSLGRVVADLQEVEIHLPGLLVVGDIVAARDRLMHQVAELGATR